MKFVGRMECNDAYVQTAFARFSSCTLYKNMAYSPQKLERI